MGRWRAKPLATEQLLSYRAAVMADCEVTSGAFGTRRTPSRSGRARVVHLQVTEGLHTLASVADAARTRHLRVLELVYSTTAADPLATIRLSVDGDDVERWLAYLDRLVGVVRMVVEDGEPPALLGSSAVGWPTS